MEEQLLRTARGYQKKIEQFAKYKLLLNIYKKNLRRTKHYQEWISQLMNYPRILELSLTWQLLEPIGQESVVDISSPKLLALALAEATKAEVHATDIVHYFKTDFEVYQTSFSGNLQLEVFDAQQMPYADGSIDKFFSISVLEHIGEQGDQQVMREIARTLRPDGLAVITLPAYAEYMEEWQKEKQFYWPTMTNERGEHFYQRRYNEEAIARRIDTKGLSRTATIYIAEQPIETPYVNDNGMLIHNAHLADKHVYDHNLLAKKTPFAAYKAFKRFSEQYHYLTLDPKDPNIRQVVIQYRKD